MLGGQVPAAIRTLNLQPTGRLFATNELRLAFGLPLRNPEALTALLARLYDPASPEYRRFLTPAQFTERFGPTAEHYEAVAAYAKAQGLKITGRHANRVLLDVSGSVADIERTLHLTLRVYPHPDEARTFYAPDVEPSLDFAVPVISVSGLSDYALPRPRKVKAAPLQDLEGPRPQLGSGPSGTYMGQDFRQAYAPNVSLTGDGEILGLVEFDGFYGKDITDYERMAGLPRVHLRTVTLDGFNGKPGPNNIEVALDIEVAIALAPGLSQIIVYEAGPYGNWLDMLNQIATDNVARQLSCSWYSPGAGPDPVADQIFQQMAAQGQSFLNASGDYDAYTGLISFPGDNPYITQVGGTTLSMTTNGGAYLSETVWNWGNGIGSGGGISTSYLLPSWQQTINAGASHGSLARRNIPDVALTADNIFVVAGNGLQLNVAGTSAAAPLWAAFVALVNQQALAANKPPVGFLNPAVYALGSGPNYITTFHDIITGNNTNASSPNEFFAVPGYDLCTGWGTPMGQQLITALAGTDSLSLTGNAGFAASGPVGGPFSVTAQAYGLADQGLVALDWQAFSDASWLTVTPSAGTLSPGQPPVAVTVSLNPSATNLTAGFHRGSVWFTNKSSGFVQARQFALAVAPSSYGGAVLALNPAAYWPLNESEAPPPADIVANAGSLGPTGNGFGVASPLQGEPGMAGSSFRFSNPNLNAGYFGAHMDIPYHAALNPGGAFTVEVWAQPAREVVDLLCVAASVDGSQNAGNGRFGWVLYQGPSAWEFRLGEGLNGYATINSGGLPLIGAWNHVVGVYDGVSASLYVNGQAVSGPSPVSEFAPNANLGVPLRIGATTFPNRTFDGWVDEVAFYAAALDSDRIAAHYNMGSTNAVEYAAEVLADRPVGYWHLDEPAYSSSGPLPVAINLGLLGGAADGTYEPGSRPGALGVPGSAFGADNTACQFDGSGYANMAGWALNLNGPLTVALWAKTDPASGNLQTLLSRGLGSYRLLLDGSGFPHFADGEQPCGDLVGPNRIDDGAWHQLVGVYDGATTESLYVDGQLGASTNGATALVAGNGNDLFIGADPDLGFYQLFHGVVDEVCVLTNALSAAQVQQLFAAVDNPLRVSPSFRGIEREGQTVVLTWTAVAGNLYQVQYKMVLTQADWNDLGTPIPATSNTASTSDPVTSTQRFYRVVLLP